MKRYKAYILVLDKETADYSFDSNDFHHKITTAKGVISWWHYIDNTYILITEKRVIAKSITDFVRSTTNELHFFISELNLNNHNGWLPNEAWEWINEHIK